MKRFQAAFALFAGTQILGLHTFAQIPEAKLALGANVNERFHWATPAILDQVDATWVRGFIPASEFLSGKRSYADDQGLNAIKAAAETGHKVILSIKWDSAGKGKFGRMPEPESKQERDAFAFVDKLLDATSGELSALVVINELSIDTLPPDLDPDSHGRIPVITFLQRVVAHVASENRRTKDGQKLPIFAGGMTRLDRAAQRSLPAYKAMIEWCNTDARISGVDFHLHQPDMETTESALAFMHRAVPSKPLMITEFSLVWRWQQHFNDRIDASDAGKKFMLDYSVPSGSTVENFVAGAFEHPVPEKEWQAFLASQPWFEPHYLNEIEPLLQGNGVKIATYALTWDPKPSSPGGHAHGITKDSVPWFLNQLLVPGMAYVPGATRLPENYGMFEDFVSYQKGK